jgi:hypothetical protein
LKGDVSEDRATRSVVVWIRAGEERVRAAGVAVADRKMEEIVFFVLLTSRPKA